MGRDRISNITEAYTKMDDEKNKKKKDTTGNDNTTENRWLSVDTVKIGKKIRIYGESFDRDDTYQITDISKTEITIQKWNPTLLAEKYPGYLEPEKLKIDIKNIENETIKLYLQYT